MLPPSDSVRILATALEALRRPARQSPRAVSARGKGLDVLANCSGIMRFGRLEDLDPAVLLLDGGRHLTSNKPV